MELKTIAKLDCGNGANCPAVYKLPTGPAELRTVPLGKEIVEGLAGPGASEDDLLTNWSGRIAVGRSLDPEVVEALQSLKFPSNEAGLVVPESTLRLLIVFSLLNRPTE